MRRRGPDGVAGEALRDNWWHRGLYEKAYRITIHLESDREDLERIGCHQHDNFMKRPEEDEHYTEVLEDYIMRMCYMSLHMICPM